MTKCEHYYILDEKCLICNKILSYDEIEQNCVLSDYKKQEFTDMIMTYSDKTLGEYK